MDSSHLLPLFHRTLLSISATLHRLHPRRKTPPLQLLPPPSSPSSPPLTPEKPTHLYQPPPLSNKLWLSNKLSAPPPPLIPTEGTSNDGDESDLYSADAEEMQKSSEFREKGKIFIGNLPLWVKKKELAEFFRQFGPIKNVILIKGHHETEMNKGFGFVIYGGSTAEKAAMKAVEFDGVEFHGRVLTVKLDDGGE
ncbi:hypothetical protein HAX54_015947 [Datura stramonium]|uniref:RRM domain-containing protein n=1 Tax=Datura stramonium TaxID=4076 RepID=A0ABS8UKD7_DATST|nr:hypothetical protein [Datura stramonium]